MKSAIKRILFQIALKTRILPRIWVIRSPFKVHEFLEVTRGVRLKDSDVVLDLGCGKGLQTQVLARPCRRTVGVDISEARIEKAKLLLGDCWLTRRLEFFSGPIQSLAFPTATFDHVFSFCVLEHIADLDDVLAELHRIMRPGGQMHMSVDSLGNIEDPELVARHRCDHEVVQYFTPETLTAKLEEAGFDVGDVFPILTSDSSRREFESRVRQGFSYGYSVLGGALRYGVLATMERLAGKDKGVMLVAHVRRREKTDPPSRRTSSREFQTA